MSHTHRSRRRVLSATVCAVLSLPLALAGCGDDSSEDDPTTVETSFPEPESPTGAVAVVLLDSSASVIRDTDLVAAAQNRISALVAQSPVGGTVVVTALNDVSGNCTDLELTLPDQNNDTLLAQAREANKQIVAPAVADYIDCVTRTDPGGTQLLGLLARALTAYPQAQSVDVYTDGIETEEIAGLRKEVNLRDPDYVEHALDGLPAALIPPMQPTTTITWHALGRGTGYDAVALSGLTTIYRRWTTLTGATAQFASD